MKGSAMAAPHREDNTATPMIEVRDIFRIIRRHWVTLLSTTLLGILATALWAALQVPTYTSTTSVLVSVSAGDNIGTALTADNLAKSKVQQYVQLGRSRAVAETATESLPYDLSPEEALSATDVTAVAGSSMLSIQAEAETPEQAQQLSTAWTAALADRVAALESGQAPSAAQQGTAGMNGIISIETLSDADLPSQPSSPNIPLALAAGALAGLIIGFFYALVRHLMDNRVRSASVIEEHFGLSILGTIPEVNRSKNSISGKKEKRMMQLSAINSRSETPDPDQFRLNESFKELRTNIEFLRPDDAPDVITVSSAHPGEGKSSIALNLALALADMGKPVVLIDGDLRRPVLASYLALVEGVGITDLMVGRAAVDDVIQFLPGYPSFAFIGAGRIPPNPSEIIASERFRQTVRSLATDALVIIDAPPLLPVTDAAILARQFDGCLLVVSAGRPTIDEFGKAVSAVRKIDGDVLGVVVNRVPTKGADSSSYQYYGKSYYTSYPDKISEES